MKTLFGLYNKSFNVCFIVNNDLKIYFNLSFFTIELSCFNVGKTIAFNNNKFCQNVLGNVGIIIRTALSFNYSSLVLSLNSVSLNNNKVVQASKCAIFGINIGREDLTYFSKNKYDIYLTSLDGIDEKELNELKKPFVIVFSNEGKGVSKEYLSLGKKIRIEMNNMDSLNVASTAAILLY